MCTSKHHLKAFIVSVCGNQVEILIFNERFLFFFKELGAVSFFGFSDERGFGSSHSAAALAAHVSHAVRPPHPPTHLEQIRLRALVVIHAAAEVIRSAC